MGTILVYGNFASYLLGVLIARIDQSQSDILLTTQTVFSQNSDAKNPIPKIKICSEWLDLSKINTFDVQGRVGKEVEQLLQHLLLGKCARQLLRRLAYVLGRQSGQMI